MPFLSAALARVKPSATIAVTDKARALKAAGPQRHRPRRRRAGFRHARQHQAGGDPRHRGRQDQVHRCRRHSRAEGGDHRQVPARERPDLQAEPDHRRHRRQAGALQRADGDPQSRRRGDHPGAVLGELSGNGGAGRRRAGAGRVPGGERLQAAARRSGKGDHAEDQVDHPQLAVEPDRRRLYARRAEGDDRRAGEASACLGDDRRHVRAPGL